MDVVIQDLALFREGRKWKERYAVLRRISPHSEVYALVFYKDINQARRKGTYKRMIHLLGFCGVSISGTIDKVGSGVTVITANETVYLAFRTAELCDDWRKHIQSIYGKEVQYSVTIPEKQKIKPGEATLRVYNRFFGLTLNKTLRCVGRWTFHELYRYASMDGGFMFETRTNSQSRGQIYKIATAEGDRIMRLFNDITENRGDRVPQDVIKDDRHEDIHGSALLDDLQRSARDPTFFQRCVLRVSARMKKPRKGNRKENTAKGGGATQTTADTPQREPMLLDRSERYLTTNPREAEADMFADPPARESSTAWVNTQRSQSFANFSLQRNSADFTSAYKNVPNSSKQPPKRVSEASRGRTSRTSASYESHASMASDVFDDTRSNQTDKLPDIPAASGPPSAPPRSPISLGSFEFAGTTDNADATMDKRASTNGDLSQQDQISGRESRSQSRGSGTPDSGADSISEKRAKEYDDLMKRFQVSSSANGSKTPDKTEQYVGSPTFDVPPSLEKHNGHHSPVVDADERRNADHPALPPGVDRGKEPISPSSPLPPKPMPIQKYVNVRIPPLPSMTEATDGGAYMNVSGSATVGRAGGRANKPQPLELKGGSLWAKYDDEDGSIYHHVDRLVSGGGPISRSVENFGNYRNINGAGSYENLTINGVPMYDKSYMNVGSTSPSKRLTGSLNYILVDGAAASDASSSPKALSAQGSSNRNGQAQVFDNFPAYDATSKTDYTMIDDKATALLNKTRQQHWQQREEDAQMKRQGKSR